MMSGRIQTLLQRHRMCLGPFLCFNQGPCYQELGATHCSMASQNGVLEHLTRLAQIVVDVPCLRRPWDLNFDDVISCIGTCVDVMVLVTCGSYCAPV